MGAAFAQAPAAPVGAPKTGPTGLSAGQPDRLCEQQQQLSGASTAGSARKPYAGDGRRSHHTVPSEVSHVGSLACGHKAVFHISEPAAVSLCERMEVLGRWG